MNRFGADDTDIHYVLDDMANLLFICLSLNEANLVTLKIFLIVIVFPTLIHRFLLFVVISTHYSRYKGSYISVHVILNLLNELGKSIKCEACRAFYLFSATSLINLIMQEH